MSNEIIKNYFLYHVNFQLYHYIKLKKKNYLKSAHVGSNLGKTTRIKKKKNLNSEEYPFGIWTSWRNLRGIWGHPPNFGVEQTEPLLGLAGSSKKEKNF